MSKPTQMTDTQSLDTAINEEVALVSYDLLWPTLFEAERERLVGLFPSQLLDVQHFGSTAIPGMPAKP
ncbi:MAG: GrpB family protein [Chthonomonadales bacterium]